jgi:hypothetical protein
MGVSYLWNGSVDGDLNKAANYTPNGIPALGDTLTIDDPPSYTNAVNTGAVTCSSAILINSSAEIWGGDFSQVLAFTNWGQIYGGKVKDCDNWNVFHNGIAVGSFYNRGHIRGGDFSDCDGVENFHTIFGESFPCNVNNYNTIMAGIFSTIYNFGGNIVDAIVSGQVDCEQGLITNGIYNGAVNFDNGSGALSGEYNGIVTNDGYFYGGNSKNTFINNLEVYDGIFEGHLWQNGSGFSGNCENLKTIKLFNSVVFDLRRGINAPSLLGFI